MLPFYREKALKARKKREKELQSAYKDTDGYSNTRLKWQEQTEVLETSKALGMPRLDYLRAFRREEGTLTFEDVTNAIFALYAPNTFMGQIIYQGFPTAGGSFRGDMRIAGFPDIGGSITVAFDETRLDGTDCMASYLAGYTPCYQHWAGNRDIPVKAIQIELPGTYLERFSLEYQLRILRQLVKLGWRFTRVDVCFDDYAKRLPLEWIYSEVGYENFVGFRKIDSRGITPADIREYGFSNLDCTLYFGSRESEKYTRIYETARKHGYHAYRVECEYKDTCCRQVIEAIIKLEGNSNDDYQIMYGIALGHIDFRASATDGDRHLERRARLPEWQAYLDYIDTESIKVSPIPSEPSLQKTMRWLIRQVSKSLAYVESISFQSVDKLIQIGQDKLRSSDILKSYYYKGLTSMLTSVENM